MAAPVVPSLIVNELLDKHNYEDWSVRVETYLVAKGLWSVVDEATEPRHKGKDKREAWKKTNAEALHAIHLCCGNDAFKVIRKEKSAHKAWWALRCRYPGDDDASYDNNIEITKEMEMVVEKAETRKEAIEGDGDASYDRNTEITKEMEMVVEEAETGKEAIEGDDVASYDRNTEITKEMEMVVEKAETGKEAIEGDLQSSDAQPQEEKADESEEEVDQDNEGTDYKPFFHAAKHGRWNTVMDVLKLHPEAIREAAPSDDGKTVLHYAVDALRIDIVQRLLQYIKTDDDLEITDNEWCTALDYCYMLPDKDGTVEIAKRLLQKKAELHHLHPEVIRPLFFGAYIHGRQKLADYLYKDTTLKLDKPQAARLVSLSFSTKRFGIACDLIQKHPSLAITNDFSDNSPLNELACTPSAFLSGSRLKFWETLIYHVISIKPIPPVKSEEGPVLTMDNKGKPTPTFHAISIDVPTQEDGNGKPTPTPDAVPIDLPTHDDDKDKPSGLIRSVTALFQGLKTENICKFLGIHRIYQMKLNHVRSLEILVCMCQVLTTEKMVDCDTKQKDFVDTAIFQAAERGLVEFLTGIFKVNPDLAKIKNEKGRNLFQVAVECRQAKVFNLIHGFNKETRKTLMNMTDYDDNNMLHMVGLFSPFAQTNSIRGAALQMQKELQWFKELESMASPEDLEAVNDTHAMKPREFFSKNHEEMVKGGETSMKETATSCTVVCALIVTMMFAAAFTVPGGNNEDNGIPKFLNRRAFRVFIVADALSLFTSATSVMFFLGVLTSRYAEEDFLVSLPRKMILGLLTLFLSVATMMIAFSSALFLMLPADSWIAFPTTLLTGIPIASFMWMQFPFLVEIFTSTYMPRTFRKNVNEKLNLGRVRFRDL